MDKYKLDVQINDILSFTLLSEEKMESGEEEEGTVLVFRSPVRRRRANADSSPPVANIRTRSVSAKKITRTAPKSTTTNAKSSPQSGRESFQTATMVIDTEVDADADRDGDDGDLSEDYISAFPI